MINHVRTLLLNQSGNSFPAADYPGEQYVPAEFRARTLTGIRRTVHNILFGVGPDRAFMNYRLQEYLNCIHGSGLENLITEYDSRITYWPFNNGLFEKIAEGVVSNKIAGATDQDIYFVGEKRLTESVNRLFFEWQVLVTSATEVRVTEYNDATGLTVNTDYAYTLTDGLSSVIPLSGSDIQVRFNGGVGAIWLIRGVASPSRNLVQVVDDLDSSLVSSTRNDLFGADAYLEDLWDRSDRLPERIAGVVLALGKRLHETQV